MAKTHKDFPFRIQDQVLGSMAILLVTVVAVYGIWVYVQSRKLLEAELSRRLSLAAELLAPQVPGALIPIVSSPQARDKLRKTLEKFRRMSRADNILVVDSKGVVVLDASKIFSQGEQNTFLQMDRFEMDLVLQSGGSAATPLYQGIEGRWYMSAYAKIPSTIDNRSYLLVIEASAVFLRDVIIFGKRLFWVALVFLALGALWCLAFARSLVSPIRRLVGAAERVAQGRFDIQVPEEPKNELGFLAQTFNEMMAQLQRHNDALLESLGSGLIAVDISGKVTTFNSSAGEILGKAADQALGRPVAEVLASFPEGLKILSGVIKGEVAAAGQEIKIGNKTLLVNASPVIDREGGVVAAELLLVDQTEIAGLRDALALRQRLAALGEMSAQVAHDIRNPLAALSGYVELVHRKLPEDSEPRRSLGKAQKEIQAINSIVSDFLTFAKTEPLDKLAANLVELVDEAVENQTDHADLKNVNIKWDPSSGILLAFDNQKLKRAILNVLSNAVEACREGGEVQVVCRPVEEGGAEIVIEDEGHGIEKEVIERLFHPFVTAKAGGTGLGLAIAQKMVRAHGGEINGSNRPSGGARFVIRLPAG